MKLQTALIFGEHMVLQRDEPIPVWGRSVRGDTVTVTLGAHSASALAGDGTWRVELPLHGGHGAYKYDRQLRRHGGEAPL